MKHYKVIVHPKTFENSDLLINPKDFPDLKIGDIIEIYHPEDEFSRLLLQVTTFKEDLQKDAISLEQSVATTFQLRTYSDVFVSKVSYDSVILDSVEVTFKDQYLGRSEMWRLKNSLVNTCVYLNKKIEFCGGTARVQVHEMWSRGERVACGVISEETKVVFRSSTSMVYLFVQMSSEMWEFDVHGDLYFEKAVNGFLADLFQKWKKHGSNHEVTIVLFSRIFYKANCIEDFPDHMRECLQRDYKNQFYEDFYRVAVQHEKYDDWSSTLILLQSLFTEYSRTVLECHKKPGCKVPNAFLSTAAHGNFLEVLNISLNVFEKHYLERSLDRTGQLSVVISPGVGVFEVDRELTNVTKQRIIDNGVGCDLVCVGEQPLHAVPLFKFHNKDTTIMRDDYSMPHWINLSFYSSDKKLAYSKFVPRIRLPSRRAKTSSSHGPLLPVNSKSKLQTASVEETSVLGCSVSTMDVDYDDYDDQVFTLPSSHIASVQKLFNRSKKQSFCQENKLAKWKLSDPDIYRSYLSSSCGALITGVFKSSSMAASDSRSIAGGLPRISSSYLEYDRYRNPDFLAEDDSGCMFDVTVNNAGSSVSSIPCVTQKNSLQNTHSPNGNVSALCPGGRALINPFDPSHVTVKVTSNRRRWTHVFPKGPTGVIIQQHHYQPTPLQETDFSRKTFPITDHESGSGTEEDSALSGCSTATEYRTRSKTSTFVGSPNGSMFLPMRKTQTLLWGATGEQQWSPDLMIGVDWKSLTIPACLPITTDYFPDEVCLKTDYVFSDYNLLPEDVNADYARKRAIYRAPLKTSEVFFELISQRLAQGFQLIVDSEANISSNQNSSTVVPKRPSNDTLTEFKLSIGRIFHKISLCKSEIRITRYRPKHPYPPFAIQYRYRFQAPDHITYGTSWVSFNAEKLENFNWNYLDHYICTRGDTDFSLIESCKYWRFRLCALPSIQPGTKKILDGSSFCNVYTHPSYEEKRALLDGFLKFIESPVNKIRRLPMQKLQQKDHLTNQLIRRRHSAGIVLLTRSQVGSGNLHSPFRERIGSINREKTFRPRSGSKVLEKQRVPPVTDIITPLTGTTDSDKDNNDVFDNNVKSTKMKELVTNVELIEMMSHPHYGVGFLSTYPSLPTNTFISYDAVQWLKKNIDGISHESEAVQQLEELRKDKLICHASGDFDHPFIFGFYLYYIPRKEDGKQAKGKEVLDKGEYVEPIRDLVTFKNEWAEVETLFIPASCEPCPIFLKNELPDVCDTVSTSELWCVPAYKQTHLEVDVTTKSDRVEWGHAKYQSVYSVEQAFELVIEWVAASGSMISDLIHSLARKAQGYNLQLVPVPADPHALPYALKSDPLRGPVFVPLDIACMVNTDGTLFEEYEEESRAWRLLLLQEEIAIQFGFISYKGGSDLYRHHNQYVHLTGNVFLLIASPLSRECCTKSCPKCRQRESAFSTSGSIPVSASVSENDEPVVSPHQEYVSRHLIDYQEDNYKSENRVGYLWSWNHMIGRRWKGTNSATNDEAFQDKLLLDFRNFCSNADDRLRRFWKKCSSLKSNGI